ncbi:MAG: peptidyl-prolyl cis-trans isomerase [Gammaproteobacteria bacterium]|jgi:peptidyl-prolyl cis-trans isomerase B (cyclophilin B)|nr:peptidyl-prolyl cis-trans isomerase [Gammaproteobacteria bacterium]MBT3488584.1 peptidyl-prolyl cis-trans isomerase [Gammaproteobacteria bacterium]MBT3718977.1 peptidyl-prolyl cis-trans isomerase [Gammaproteobacteria bacterium]MBT3846226.1 peptidyl-prolyl cis-trans isomerase [Gammaproteobacteria bacterium]MBT3893971.1 peptidyl-prolyl cis-trans isomerase [Gammaproteobacteria bacterium]
MIVKMTTSHGEITIELNAEKAPQTVENFIDYCRDGFYDGTIFHRIIPGFMVQGGGMEPGMAEKPTNEPVENEANNGLKNDVGTLAMARTMDPHSATAQFFINTNSNGFLNYPGQDGWGYCVFGEVTEGMDVVREIEKVETGSRGFHDDVPKDDVVIEKVEVQE